MRISSNFNFCRCHHYQLAREEWARLLTNSGKWGQWSCSLAWSMQDEGWISSVQWTPAHSSIPGNEWGDVSPAVMYVEDPSIITWRIHDARHFIYADIQQRYPHPNLARDSLLKPAPLHWNSWTASSVRHKLRISCTFMQKRLFLLGHTQQTVFWYNGQFRTCSLGMPRIPQCQWGVALYCHLHRNLCASVKDILLPCGSRGSACVLSPSGVVDRVWTGLPLVE